MKVKELRDKNPEELKSILQDKRVELCQLRFELKANQIQNHQQLKMIRRDIARIETILKERKEK